MKLSNARDKQYKQNLINKMGSPPSAHQKEGTKPSRSGGEPSYIKPSKVIICLILLWSGFAIDFYFIVHFTPNEILCNLMIFLIMPSFISLTIYWLYYIKQYRNHIDNYN